MVLSNSLPCTNAHLSLGPVVRITPDEIHLSDPDNYEVMHCVGTKYPKSTQFYNGFGIGYSTFSAGPIHVHKPRRAMLDPYFSRKNVLALEHLVQARAENISDILTTKLAKGEAVDLHHAFRAISVDVISDYAFGESYGLLDTPDFGHEFFDMVSGIGPTMWFFQQFPAIQMLAMSLPAPIAKMTSKPLKQVLTLQEVG
jgi:cytochrome P450